jgi:phosphoenolpyruvate carboxylase
MRRRDRTTCYRGCAFPELIMNELTREQVDDLRRTAEYLTVQMRLTPHPTERTRIRVMADTADFVAERIDAFLRSGAQNGTHASNR